MGQVPRSRSLVLAEAQRQSRTQKQAGAVLRALQKLVTACRTVLSLAVALSWLGRLAGW